jgi:hypothetical protein
MRLFLGVGALLCGLGALACDLASIGEIRPLPDKAVIPSSELARLEAEGIALLEAEARARRDAASAREVAERQAAAAELARLEERGRLRAEAARAAFEQAYPMHGVVYHFIAQVFAQPNRDKPIGYMRRGALFRAREGTRGPGCDQTWHEVPGGGFVCRGGGFLLGTTPQSFDPSPVPPALDDALPYLYAYTAANDRPQFWRLPTADEESAAAAAIAELGRIEDSSAAARSRNIARGSGSDGGLPAGEVSEAPAAAPNADDQEASDSADAVEAPPPPGRAGDSGAQTPSATEALPLPSFLRARMRRGFYVSLDREETTDVGRLFYRTVRGGYVRASDLVPNEPPESRGVVLGGTWQLPIGVVFHRSAHRYRRDSRTGRVHENGAIDRHTALPIAQDDLVIDARRYVVSPRGTLVRDSAVRMLRRRGRPPGVPREAKWIHVDLTEQTLIAYEGDEPVFGTVVSTGKPGHETPTGLYRIQSKHVSTTMDDLSNDEGAYSIEDVPWTMYFHGNYAIHGAFWHYTFGRVRSHGCVNLAPADARWLFQWSTPTLPASWHGMFANPRGERAGTFVFIE